jgi:acyl-CoA synthetase (AMP-forming)/AMP-acid ligase II
MEVQAQKPQKNVVPRGEDRLYTGMPLYHSSGQWFAMGTSIYAGTTVILRKTFSATHFW